VDTPDFVTTADCDEWGNFGTDTVQFDVMPATS